MTGFLAQVYLGRQRRPVVIAPESAKRLAYKYGTMAKRTWNGHRRGAPEKNRQVAAQSDAKLSLGDQCLAADDYSQLRSVARPGLAKRRCDVRLDGPGRDLEAASNLVVREPPGYELGNLHLARGERLRPLA